MADKYSATWVSHSSISDFLKCQRLYFLKNVYKDQNSGHKVQIMSPPLALGQIVHEVIEGLSQTPVEQRFSVSLIEKFNDLWPKVSGKKGGFSSPEGEERYKARGEEMLRRVMANPGPLANRAVKIKEELPQYWLSVTDEIKLCGKLDWLEYLPHDDTVHIIDFKTSKKEEDGNSLQLPIYHLLATNTQQRKVSKMSYWYLELSDELTPKELPNLEESQNKVMEVAKKMKLARKLGVMKCAEGGCSHCEPFERIIKGEGEFVGVNSYNTDVYILDRSESKESVIL